MAGSVGHVSDGDIELITFAHHKELAHRYSSGGEMASFLDIA